MYSLVVTALGFGIVIASVLSQCALGFNLTFAVSKVMNIGFLGFMLVGQFTALGVYRATGQLLFATGMACVAAAALGLVVYTALVEPFSKRQVPPFVLVLVLFAFTTFLVSLLSVMLGADSYVLNESSGLRHPVHIAGMLFTTVQLIVIGLSAAMALLIDLAMRFTGIGRALRAISDDAEFAASKGVNVRFATRATWILSGLLGGTAGVCLALVQGSFSTKGEQTYFVLVIAAAFLGGAGKPYGAVIGALAVGIATQIAAIWVAPDLSPVIAFAALIVVIIVRPGGILGAATEEIRP